MKKSLALLAVAGALFVGCGSKNIACKVDIADEKLKATEFSEAYIVQGRYSSNTISGGYNVRSKSLHALQNAAQLTLDKGYRYFAIILPKGELSNSDGSLINTTQEFIDKCMPSAGNIYGHHFNSCGLGGSSSQAMLSIAMSKEQNSKIITYDAQEVIDYLKANELFREDGLDEVQDICVKK